MKIEYVFTLEDGRAYPFTVDLDRSFTTADDQAPHAGWTELEFEKCPNCPYRADDVRHCPPAVDLEGIARVFVSIISYEKVTIEVRTPERAYVKKCDVQTGLQSLLGLVMATSACPILSRLRGLARYHLPFATLDETVFRTVGGYLLTQYFRHRYGLKPDLDLQGLEDFYRQLSVVDSAFKHRLDSISIQDANQNAISTLAMLAMIFSMKLSDQIKELEPLFREKV